MARYGGLLQLPAQQTLSKPGVLSKLNTDGEVFSGRLQWRAEPQLTQGCLAPIGSHFSRRVTMRILRLLYSPMW